MPIEGVFQAPKLHAGVLDVPMNIEVAEARDDVLGGLARIASQRFDLVELATQHADRDRAGVGIGACGGQRQAVAEGGREPELEQLAGRPTSSNRRRSGSKSDSVSFTSKSTSVGLATVASLRRCV